MSRILDVSMLTKAYQSNIALDKLSLTVEKGQVLGLLGPNGSGKTTALGIILGVTRATTGSFHWFNTPDKKPLKGRIGALLEQPDFLPWYSGWNHLKMVSYARGVTNWQPAAQKALEMVHLWDQRNTLCRSYSLGMLQRLAVASCLLNDPEVLVLDEPTNGVDAQGIASIRKLIKQLAENGKTIILASHILDEVEKVCSHVHVLRNGRTLETGEIQTVLATNNRLEVSATAMENLKKAISRIKEFCERINS